MKKMKKGFTLVELLVVMALIAVLAVLILGAIQLARNTATETVDRSNAKVVQAALESNFAKFKEYCGAAAGEIPCPAGSPTNGDTYGKGSNYSLASAAAALSPSVGLSNGAASGTNCVAGATQNGGGRIINLTTTGYAIAPANYNCTSYTSINDVVQTGLTTTLASLPATF